MGEAGSFRISRPEEVIQRNRSFPSGLGGMSLSPRWVVSIEVSEDESVRGARKDVRIEGPGARIRRTVSDGRGVEVKKLKRRVVGEKDFNTGVV